MRSLKITKESLNYIGILEPKFFKQVMNKVLHLLSDPVPADSAALREYVDLYRADIGEHRTVYRFDESSVSVLVVDKRNDDEVYKKLARKKP